MKKIIRITIGAIVILGVILVIGLNINNSERKPLKNLDANEVVSIEAAALPPNEIKYINQSEDIIKIIDKLKKVVVSERVKQNEYAGQVIMYTLIMKGGSKREVMISNPIVRIDGVFYKVKYDSTDDLANLYNKLRYKSIKKNN